MKTIHEKVIDKFTGLALRYPILDKTHLQSDASDLLKEIKDSFKIDHQSDGVLLDSTFTDYLDNGFLDVSSI
jgi:hypothetical protein